MSIKTYVFPVLVESAVVDSWTIQIVMEGSLYVTLL